MAFVPLSNRIGSGDQITDVDVSNFDSVVIRPVVNIISTDSEGIDLTHANVSLQIDGYVFGDQRGVDLDHNATGGFTHVVSIGATGAVGSEASFALYLGSNTDVLDTSGNRITLNNAGLVTSLEYGAAFLFYAETASVTNSGTIRSLALSGGSFNAAVNFYAITRAHLVNSGTIEVTSPTLLISNAAVYAHSLSTSFTLVNTGLISAPSFAIGSDAISQESVTNQGVIGGDVRLSNTAASTLVNRGTILGDVELRGGADRYDGRGASVITGEVFGGTDGDTLLGGDGGEVLHGEDGDDRLSGLGGDDALNGGNDKDTLYGGAGDDTVLGGADTDLIYGGAHEDQVTGEAGNDTLYGGAGDDTLSGGSNEDLIYGGADDDRLEGEGSADRLYGGAGDDTVDGGTNNDTVSGGAGDDLVLGNSGNDSLYGGWGRDTMTGGTGADVFVFNTAPEGMVDEITDFSVIDDTIRLEDSAFLSLSAGALAAAAFVANTSGLATTAAHRVIYETDTGALFFDADGTGTTARVHFATLSAGLALTNADFLVV